MELFKALRDSPVLQEGNWIDISQLDSQDFVRFGGKTLYCIIFHWNYFVIAFRLFLAWASLSLHKKIVFNWNFSSYYGTVSDFKKVTGLTIHSLTAEQSFNL